MQLFYFGLAGPSLEPYIELIIFRRYQKIPVYSFKTIVVVSPFADYTPKKPFRQFSSRVCGLSQLTRCSENGVIWSFVQFED